MASATQTDAAAQQRRHKVLMAQYAAYSKNPSPYVIAVPDEADISKWIVLVCNLAAPFEFGEYLFTFAAGPDFPHKPPVNLCCHTANGVFVPGGKICISIGEYHAADKGRTDTWRPALGMKGFADNIGNSMICYDQLKGGVRIVEDFSPVAMRALARLSRASNHKNNAALSSIIEDFIASHLEFEPVKMLLAGRTAFASQYAQTGNVAQGAAGEPAGIAVPFLTVGARTPSLSSHGSVAGSAPTHAAPPAPSYAVPGMGVVGPAAQPAKSASAAAHTAQARADGADATRASAVAQLTGAMSLGGVVAGRMGGSGMLAGSMAGFGGQGTVFPSAIPHTVIVGGNSVPSPGAAPAGATYASGAAWRTDVPATHAHTVGAYAAPPPQPRVTPYASTRLGGLPGVGATPQVASLTSASFMGGAHVGMSSGHSMQAVLQQASDARTAGDRPPALKTAFSPSQTFHLHNSSGGATGAYNHRIASFAEAAAAASKAAGAPLAGQRGPTAEEIRLQAAREQDEFDPADFALLEAHENKSQSTPLAAPFGADRHRPPPQQAGAAGGYAPRSERRLHGDVREVANHPGAAYRGMPYGGEQKTSFADAGPQVPQLNGPVAVVPLAANSAMARYGLTPVAAPGGPGAEPAGRRMASAAAAAADDAGAFPIAASPPSRVGPPQAAVQPILGRADADLAAVAAATRASAFGVAAASLAVLSASMRSVAPPQAAEHLPAASARRASSPVMPPATGAERATHESADALADEVDRLLLGDDALAAAVNAVNDSFDAQDSLEADATAADELTADELTADELTADELPADPEPQGEDSDGTEPTGRQAPSGNGDQMDSLIDSLLDE